MAQMRAIAENPRGIARISIRKGSRCGIAARHPLIPRRRQQMVASYENFSCKNRKAKKRTLPFCLMDGRASLEEIAHKLASEFPKRFSSWHEALSYAGGVSQEFSR
jgi:hypothetical protein